MSDNTEHYLVRINYSRSDKAWDSTHTYENKQAARDKFDELTQTYSRARVQLYDLTNERVVVEQ